MPSPFHVCSAVLIADGGAPLQLNRNYLFRTSTAALAGRIASVTQRLESPYVVSTSESSLQPREMACVEIAMASSTPANALAARVQELAVIEPVAGRQAGVGLLFPDGQGDDDRSKETGSPQGLAVWLTGLSGAGKTTIARQVQEQLQPRCPVEVLDADIVRAYLCKDLGYTRPDREENIRRLGFVADLLTKRGRVVLITAIAPYRAARDAARKRVGRFIEVYVNAPLSVCEQRDVKGLYKRARAGEIRLFTGIDDPYEAPLAAEVECHTDRESIALSATKVVMAIEQKLHGATNRSEGSG